MQASVSIEISSNDDLHSCCVVFMKVSKQRIATLAALTLLLMSVLCTFMNGDILKSIKVAKCKLLSCLPLGEAKLRERVVKNFIHLQMEISEAANDKDLRYVIVLLPIEIGSKEILEGIERGSLLDMLSNGAVELRSHRDVDALAAEQLDGKITLATYSLTHRNADFFPIGEIRAISKNELSADLAKRGKRIPDWGAWNRFRGYGELYFMIREYVGIDLACCDGRGVWNGESVEQRNSESVDAVRRSEPFPLPVSSTGEIFVTRPDGYFIYNVF